MKKIFIGLLILLVLPAQPFGFYKELSKSLFREAMDYGVNNKTMDADSFSKPWTIENGWESCLVFTKYFEVSFYQSIAARMNAPLTLEELVHVAYAKKDTSLYFVIKVLGDSVDFASDLHSVIKINSLIIQPIEKENEYYASESPWWPDSPAYSATCRHYYAMKDLPPNAKIQLIVKKQSGSETIFDIDLSKIK